MRCKACREKNRLIESLEEQVEWLRMQYGTPLLKTAVDRQAERQEEGQTAQELLDQPWQDDMTEDLEFMAKQQILNAQELESALAAVGSLNTTIEFN